MTPSVALQEEYRRCMERDFRRGHVGICTDSPLKEMLWRNLLEDPELHSDFQEEDPFVTFAAALRGHLDLRAALRNLSKAFEVLELAAINLYFFPWRKEFRTIKTFSGTYVHILQGVLPAADILKSFHRLGYVQHDNLHLVLSKPLSAPGLLCAACGFFAARVECEILEKLVERLEPCVVSPSRLFQARQESDGTLEGCVAKLQSLVRRPRSREVCVEPVDGVDLYQESPELPSPYGDSPGIGLPSPLEFASSECSRSASPRMGRKEQPLWSPQPLLEHQSKLRASGQDPAQSNGLTDSEAPSLETSFSFISLRRQLSRTTDTDFPAPLPGGRFLSPGPSYECPGPQPYGADAPASPGARRSPQLSPASARRAQGSAAGVAVANELPRYHLHSCVGPGTLPASCCNTCRSLHAAGCDEAQTCRGNHQLEDLQSEKQKWLWLQRTEVDKLMQEGSWP